MAQQPRRSRKSRVGAGIGIGLGIGSWESGMGSRILVADKREAGMGDRASDGRDCKLGE